MKKMLSIVTIALIVLSTFSLISPRAKAEEMIFEDDFENYAVDAFPSPPWQMWFSGKGTAEQRIVDTEHVSGSKSLRLWGADGWGAVAARPITLTVDTIGYEVMVKAENWGLQYETKTGAILGFGYKISGSLWTYWGRVIFQSDGYVRGRYETIQSYALGTWYKVKTIFDIPSGMYSVWIDDQFRGTFTDGISYDPSLIEAFTLASDHAEQICYFDDVKVFEVPIGTPATIDINPETLNLRSKGKWITGYIELTEGYDVADIDVSTILLNDTVLIDPDAPTVIGDYDEDGIPDLMVKFDRASVIDYIEDNMDWSDPERTKPLTYLVTLTVTGSLHDGTSFEGSDTVRVLKFLKDNPKPE